MLGTTLSQDNHVHFSGFPCFKFPAPTSFLPTNFRDTGRHTPLYLRRANLDSPVKKSPEKPIWQNSRSSSNPLDQNSDKLLPSRRSPEDGKCITTHGTNNGSNSCEGKFLGRKCASRCIFAPYFGSDQGTARFAAVHKVFGASSISKLLVHIPANRWHDAVLTISYEA